MALARSGLRWAFNAIVLVLLLSAAGPGVAIGPDMPLPPGWRPVDLAGWRREAVTYCDQLRPAQQPMIRLDGDFDGDGSVDQARILVMDHATYETTVFISRRRDGRVIHEDVGGIGPGDDIEVIPCKALRRATLAEPCPRWRKPPQPCWIRHPGARPAGIAVIQLGVDAAAEINPIVAPRYLVWDADKARFVEAD